jgi:hypothetical protein
MEENKPLTYKSQANESTFASSYMKNRRFVSVISKLILDNDNDTM